MWKLGVITAMLQMSFRDANKLEYGHTAGEQSREGLNAGRMDPVACVLPGETYIKTLRSLFLPEGLLLRDSGKQTPHNGCGVTGLGAKRCPRTGQCLQGPGSG